MRANFHRRKKIRGIMYSTVTVILLGAMFVVVVNATWDVYKKEKLARASKGNASQELFKLEDRKEFLDNKIDRLGTQKGLEEEFRGKFGVVKEGEELVMIVDKSYTGSSTDTSSGDDSSGWFDKFLSFLKIR